MYQIDSSLVTLFYHIILSSHLSSTFTSPSTKSRATLPYNFKLSNKILLSSPPLLKRTGRKHKFRATNSHFTSTVLGASNSLVPDDFWFYSPPPFISSSLIYTEREQRVGDVICSIYRRWNDEAAGGGGNEHRIKTDRRISRVAPLQISHRRFTKARNSRNISPRDKERFAT